MQQPQSASKGIQFLDVQPAETIEFKYIEGKNLISVLNIENRSTMCVAYKIKTTNPKNYLVKPNQGFLSPNEKITVDIQLQHYVTSNKLQFNKDKFQIQAAQIMDTNPKLENFTQIWNEIPQQSILMHKLQVLLTSSNDNQQFSTPQKSDLGQSNRVVGGGGQQQQDQFKSIYQSIDQLQQNPQLQQNTSQLNQQQQLNQQTTAQVKSSLTQPSQNQSFPYEGFTAANKNNENQQKFEDILSKVQNQEKLLMSLSEERNNYQTELEQYKNLANSKSQNYKDESSGFQFWHIILVAIISLIIGGFLSMR